jgi:hypothetical protein
MGTWLLREAWLLCYLSLVAALLAAKLRDYLHNPRPARGEARAPRKEVASWAPGLFLPAARHNLPGPVTGRRPWPDKAVDPSGDDRRAEALTEATPESMNQEGVTC